MNAGNLIRWAWPVGLCVFASSAMADGRVAYLQNCAACHGRFAGGDGPATAALAIPVPDLRRLASAYGGEFPGERVAQVIDGREVLAAHGDRSMPIWGTEFWLQEGCDNGAEEKVKLRVQELVDYLASIQVNE